MHENDITISAKQKVNPRNRRFLNWLLEQCEWNNEQFEHWCEYIADDVHKGEKENYRSCVHWFVRRLKAELGFEDLNGHQLAQILDAAFSNLRNLLNQPDPSPPSTDPWSVFLPTQNQYGVEIDPRAEFIDTCNTLRRPMIEGGDDLDIAWRKAQEQPLTNLPKWASIRDIQVMSIAYHLHKAAPAGGYIVLPQDRIGELIGLSQRAVSTILKNAVAAGWLRVHRKADSRRGQAGEFVYLL